MATKLVRAAVAALLLAPGGATAATLADVYSSFTPTRSSTTPSPPRSVRH